MSTSWAALVEHAEQHQSAIATSEASDLGISSSALASWCVQGRLFSPAPDVYVVSGTPDTWKRRVMVAVLSAAGWASHRTAAALWELDGFPAQDIEVLTPRGLRRRRKEVKAHETRRFRGVDLDVVDGIPCTTVARTILDLPAVAHPFAVGQAIDDACRRWPGMLDTIAQRFAELGGRGRPGAHVMRVMLEERMGRGRFAQSGFEMRTVRLVRAAGLPEPVLQHQVRDDDFVAYLDMAWPRIKWAIECDSLAFHSGKRAHEWDRKRRRRLKELGWDLIEVTYDDVTQRGVETGRQLKKLYLSREASILAAHSSS